MFQNSSIVMVHGSWLLIMITCRRSVMKSLPDFLLPLNRRTSLGLAESWLLCSMLFCQRSEDYICVTGRQVAKCHRTCVMLCVCSKITTADTVTRDHQHLAWFGHSLTDAHIGKHRDTQPQHENFPLQHEAHILCSLPSLNSMIHE